MSFNSQSGSFNNIDLIKFTEDSSKTVEQFHKLKNVISEISKTFGNEMNSVMEVSATLVMLKVLLGEEKFISFLEKMKIVDESNLN